VSTIKILVAWEERPEKMTPEKMYLTKRWFVAIIANKEIGYVDQL